MRRRLTTVLVAVTILLALAVAAAYARLSNASTRAAAEVQLSAIVGQPAVIGSIGVQLLPTPAISLVDVRVGDANQVTIARLDLAASLKALASGRIEDADVTGSGVRVRWPLPVFSLQSAPKAGWLKLVSIRGVRLADVTVSAGGRSWTGEIEAEPVAGRWIARVGLYGDAPVPSLTATVSATTAGATFDPVSFQAVGGEGQGRLEITFGAPGSYRLLATLRDAETAEVAALAGKPGLMTGALHVALDVSGRLGAANVIRQSMRGTARVRSIDGTLARLGVPGVAYSLANMSLVIDQDMARTDDLRFDSSALSMTGQGTFALDGSRIDVTGRARLAGGTVVPASIGGPLADPDVRIESNGPLGRVLSALQAEDPTDAIQRALGALLSGRPKASGGGS